VARKANRIADVKLQASWMWGLEPHDRDNLLRIDWIVSITVLLELFGQEEEEEDRISPMLRVQAPLYRWGPGYRLGIDSAGCRLLGGGVLGVIFWPCSGRGTL
jgi:hypothetical protein